VTMPQTLSSMSRRNQIALVCAGLLLVGIIGYFAMISSKRSEASDLQAQTASVQAQIDRNKMSPYAKALPAVRAATVYRLAQAMPDDVAMADVILELNKIADDSGIAFNEITPEAPATDTNYDVHPINVVFSGNYYSLSDFLLRVRNLVRVHDGKLMSKGRAYAVSDVTFSEDSKKKFPYISATLKINAFVVGKGTSATQPPTATGTTTSTTPTSTTPTTTTPSGASAASATTPSS
jgi:Tfp pilus assembly protein PilO